MAQTTGSKLKLMVVDDEPDNLDLLYRTFRRDFDVIQADSAITALDILDKLGEMAIIISDQRMPEMLGTEFLSKTVDRFPDTIRIVLTGYTDVEDLVEAINAGKVFKYITKPWTPDNLRRVVEQAAETYRVIKQRTNELRRALRRESIFNVVTTAIHESLDYHSMLTTIVQYLGNTFETTRCCLYPVENWVFMAEAVVHAGEPAADPHSLDPDANALIQLALEQQALQVEQTAASTQKRLVVPLMYQHSLLAVLLLERLANWSPEDIELIEGVAEQAALAISQAKLYQQTQHQAEQMRAELAVARQIQSNLLRQEFPTVDGVRIQACCYPAREIGGDFFEVYAHPQDDLWLAVGDVSGKGVPAALFMASAISLLRRELSQELPPDPHVVMQNLNRSLNDDLISANCFITMVLARYTPATRRLVYANAGHIYPLVWSRTAVAAQAVEQGNTVAIEPTYLKVRGVPLGILPDWQAKSDRLDLVPGDVVLITSDGITEVTIQQPQRHGSPVTSTSMLQQSGLWQLLLQEQDSLDLAHLLSRVRAHNTIQEDDQTILALEVL